MLEDGDWSLGGELGAPHRGDKDVAHVSRVHARSGRRLRRATFGPRFVRQNAAGRSTTKIDRVTKQLQALAEKREQMRQMQKTLEEIQVQNRKLEERNRTIRARIAEIEKLRRLASKRIEFEGSEVSSINNCGL